MPHTNALCPEDREFFAQVARAVATNPFGDEWRDAMARIVPDRGDDAATQTAAVEVVRARLAQLETRGDADLRQCAPEDKDVLAFAFLFDAYYGLSSAFDALIDEQLDAGAEPIPVAFASPALELLQRRGFDRERALRHFAMFFQLRRAYYFIDRTLIGRSPCMRSLRRALWNNVFTRDIRWYADYLWNRMEDFSTLLLGETGTGKGSAAAAIGRSGFIPFLPKQGTFAESFTRAFVPLNLSQFPEPLIESELFGHEKGAFTGATERYSGAFATCSPYGAVFLDELGELADPIQVKLLRVLQERHFTPVGSRKSMRFRGRVIGATNRQLAELRQPGAMRDDFFYRLCSDLIVVPTLHQRLAEAPGELTELVAHTLTRMLGEPAPPLVRTVCEVVESELGPGYRWPGNVRELEQCVRRILLKGSYGAAQQPSTGQDDAPRALLDAVHAGSLDARGLLGGYCRHLYQRLGSYERVAQVTRLDRRTVKRHIDLAAD